MSRPQRIEYENAFYHVMNRGAGRRKIFNNDQERTLFLSIISEAHLQFNIEIHAYCLMTNHYHLLIKTPSGNLSRAMRHINGVYTQRYNRLNITDGPLFRGRYKSILVDSDSYLLHLSKYIHLNPLEARMVDELRKYKWSSYPAYIGTCPPPTWLFQSEIYGQLTNTSNKMEAYRLFMNETELNNKIKVFYHKERKSPVLGSDLFISSLKVLNQSKEIPREDRLLNRPPILLIIKETAQEFSQSIETTIRSQKGRGRENTPRKIAMYIAKTIWGYRLKEITEAFGLSHYGGVANAIFMVSKKLEVNPELSLKLNTIIKRLDPSH
ncbi:chromosomal replication initiation protein [Legionella lansingensis]|uniref:Chromosomal replication initiation protein n=1 Tax=Legionella lansingensis TaxID=45067 RepID=A0A0W0VU24_9GAMM|nr:transposase [Legionella lansingensis]KTD23522.1 chromosomal replication initiation protein [Legionella lansingensis]SNV52055.1 chromosomal replication initiation protein [Legionella lansingensis]